MTLPEPATSIPRVQFGIIGGSGTREIRFPEDLADPRVTVLEDRLTFETPFGRSARFKLLEISGDGPHVVPKRALYARYHGWQTFGNRFEEQERTFWILNRAGVKRLVAEGTIGSVNSLLDPGDLVVPHDFFDERTNTSKQFQEGKLVRMRAPLCPELRAHLIFAAEQAGFPRVFRRGVYAVTEGPRFETPAEITKLRLLGADVVGQSLCPEAYLARSIGACYASAYMVTNYGEGMIAEWDDAGLWDRYRGNTRRMGEMLLAAAIWMGPPERCLCAESSQRRPDDVLAFPDR